MFAILKVIAGCLEHTAFNLLILTPYPYTGAKLFILLERKKL